jgi:hypothetical protein
MTLARALRQHQPTLPPLTARTCPFDVSALDGPADWSPERRKAEMEAAQAAQEAQVQSQ